MWAVYKKELKTYFYSPLAYVLSGIFVLVFGIYFLTQTMSKVGQGMPSLCLVDSFILQVFGLSC